MLPRTGTSADSGSCASLESSNEFSNVTPPTVVTDEILECDPDTDEAYDERLLWLSENLCLGRLMLCLSVARDSGRELGVPSRASYSDRKDCDGGVASFDAVIPSVESIEAALECALSLDSVLEEMGDSRRSLGERNRDLRCNGALKSIDSGSE
jgi:hypothetical protein